MSDPSLQGGETLNQRYRILSTLGRGSFASVYLARDSQWRGNLVAIKEISTEGFSEEEYRDMNTQFLQEAAFLMQLDHPGLPRMVEFFASGTRYYLAMEWIAGKSLHEIIHVKGPASEDEVIEWGLQICEILAYLHARSPFPVVLGDLKPSNVMITYEGRVKVVDFGIARYLAPSQNPRTFAMVSPGFSPPEKYSKFDSDLRGDIYSLGATMYWALTRTPLEKFRFQIPPLRRLRPDAHPLMESILARCLETERGRRWVRVAALQEQLVKLREEKKSLQAQAEKQNEDILGQLYRKKYGN